MAHEPNEDIVALLEEELAAAKAGKTVALAITSVERNGEWRSRFSFEGYPIVLLGALTYLVQLLGPKVAGPSVWRH